MVIIRNGGIQCRHPQDMVQGETSLWNLFFIGPLRNVKLATAILCMAYTKFNIKV